MKNYSEYTIEELKSMIEEQRELIHIRECGNDFYYSSGQYDEDKKKKLKQLVSPFILRRNKKDYPNLVKLLDNSVNLD